MTTRAHRSRKERRIDFALLLIFVLVAMLSFAAGILAAVEGIAR